MYIYIFIAYILAKLNAYSTILYKGDEGVQFKKEVTLVEPFPTFQEN